MTIEQCHEICSWRLTEVLSHAGFREGCLDQLAFDSMIPIHKLKEYADMVSV